MHTSLQHHTRLHHARQSQGKQQKWLCKGQQRVPCYASMHFGLTQRLDRPLWIVGEWAWRGLQVSDLSQQIGPLSSGTLNGFLTEVEAHKARGLQADHIQVSANTGAQGST